MKRVMFAGGGTGGHLFPAFAIAEEIKRRAGADARIRFFVTGRDLEQRLISSRGYEMTRIHVKGLKRGTTAGNIMFFPILLIGIIEAVAKVISFNPDFVVGTGGYLSFPAVLAAKLTSRPAFIQEQNSYAGIASRKLAPYADLIFIAYEDAARHVKWTEKCILSGNPVNPQIGKVEPDAGVKEFGLDPDKRTLLIFGGSQGAASINQKVADSLEQFKQVKNLQMIWQVGEAPEMIGRFNESGMSGVALKFIENMPAAYAAAALIVCRAGALTLSEVTAAGKPSILIPFPHATDDHQTKNAQSLVDADAAILVKDEQLPDLNLVSLVKQLLDDDSKLMQMGMSASGLGRRGAGEAIVQRIYEFMGWR
jgi:UDP-N-acetylglucosamine--N-acetylmuramyl-(pentapeptide) pyrophosphoryl-undecaprenol N-acetylglucosamine transferase